jgi:hypothetical protein
MMDRKKGRDMQGEGNYDAAKEFNDAEQKFAESGRVDDAARDAEPESEAEAEELAKAEEIGRARAKDDKPTPAKNKRPHRSKDRSHRK